MAVGAFLVYVNWRQLETESKYSMKIAAFAPLCVIGGVFMLLSPANAGKPSSTKQKLLVFAIFLMGLAAGLVNWYLMDPGFFGR
jgi:hypothetical protein